MEELQPIKADGKKQKKEEDAKNFKKKYTHMFAIANEAKNKLMFPSNEIVTAKYFKITAFFKAFISQFMRIPVIYFSVIAILEAISYISPYSPIPTFVALIFVVCLGVIRELFEDLNRTFSDLTTNTTLTTKYRQGAWRRVNWKDIYVGDIIRIKENEQVPADCVCLAAANYNLSFNIQTNFIDGKTKLWKRRAIEPTNQIIGNGEVYRLAGEAELFQVSSDIHQFDGLILIGDELEIEVNELNFLPRGSFLRNCGWVIALVGFTGADCKIFMNHTDKLKSKTTKLQGIIDIGTFIVIAFQLVFCIIIAILAGVWASEVGGSYRNLTGRDLESWKVGLAAIPSFLILTSLMVPLILIICLEMIRSTLAYFLTVDELMYDSKNSAYPEVQNAGLMEQLGQVQYLVVDKTGTLTDNKFQLKLLMIGTELYGDPGCLSESVQSSSESNVRIQYETGDVQYVFHDVRLSKIFEGYLANNPKIDLHLMERHTSRILFTMKDQLSLVKEFLLQCAICNSCDVHVNDETYETSYSTIHPDELASVDLAKKLGAELLESGVFFKRVNLFGIEEHFEIVKNIRYNSLRKRSTIIVKHGDLIKLYCKGVPEVIYGIQDSAQDERFNDASAALLDAANNRGFRTLSFGMRIVSEAELKEFNSKLEKANKFPEGPDRDTLTSRLDLWQTKQ